MFFTPKETFALDLAAVIEYVASECEGVNPVLFGHSAGGGISQVTLHLALAHVYALGLIGASPNYGVFWAYVNWFFKVDVWAFPRFIKDLCHPRSPLSRTQLVHNAFFSETFPTKEVK